MNAQFKELRGIFDLLFGKNAFQRFHNFFQNKGIQNIDFHSIEPKHIPLFFNLYLYITERSNINRLQSLLKEILCSLIISYFISYFLTSDLFICDTSILYLTAFCIKSYKP